MPRPGIGNRGPRHRGAEEDESEEGAGEPRRTVPSDLAESRMMVARRTIDATQTMLAAIAICRTPYATYVRDFGVIVPTQKRTIPRAIFDAYAAELKLN